VESESLAAVKKFFVTPSAEADMFEIWAYIAKDSVEAADQIEAELLASCRKLASHPELGHRRNDLTERPVHFYNVRGTYLIVFDAASEPLQIIRILHGARDAASQLR
jgi:antitoxin ParD1/3/4